MGNTFFEKVTEGEKRIEPYVRVSTIFSVTELLLNGDLPGSKTSSTIYSPSLHVCVSTHISIPNVDKVPFHLSWVCPKSNDACGVTQIRLGDKVSTSCLFNKKRTRIRGFPCEHALKLRSFNYFGPRGMKHKGLIVKSSQKCFWSTPPPRMSVTNEGLKGVPTIKFNNLGGDWQPGWGGVDERKWQLEGNCAVSPGGVRTLKKHPFLLSLRVHIVVHYEWQCGDSNWGLALYIWYIMI